MFRSWQRAQLATVALAIIAFGLVGCRDDGNLTEAGPTEAGPAGSGPQSDDPTSAGGMRTGYILGRNGKPLEIKFEVQGDQAIMEGDIVLGPADSVATSPEQLETPRAHVPGGPSYGVVIDGSVYRWPGGVVPYYIDPSVLNTSRVTGAIASIEANSPGVDLVPYAGQKDFVWFKDGAGCSSLVGRHGGGQVITINNPGCDAPRVMHEILHALGMGHEQSRCDRDQYVQIVWENIQRTPIDRTGNFQKLCDGYTDLFPYSEGSVMHYGPNDFAIDPTKPTIISLRGLPIGQRDGLGPTDITTINRLYPGTTTSGPWASRSAMPTARKQLATAVLNGLIYAIGGTNSTPTANLTKVEAYNPSTNTWTTRASLPSGQGRTAGAAVINGVLYVAGGYGVGSAGLTRTLYAYNGSTWSTKAAMPIAGGCGGSGAIGGKLFVLVGCDPSTTTTSNSKGILLQYNPATNAWSTKPSAPSAHRSPGVAVLGGKLYVVGGKTSIGVATNELHVYDPATNSWSIKAAMPAARYNLAAYPVNGLLYAVGGLDGGEASTSSVYIYNPATNTWKTGASMPTARGGEGGGSINGALYVVGGYTTSGAALATNERLTP